MGVPILRLMPVSVAFNQILTVVNTPHLVK